MAKLLHSSKGCSRSTHLSRRSPTKVDHASRITHHALTLPSSAPTLPRSYAPTSPPAFTLLELMIVLAIIGILTALAMPHLKGVTRSNVMAAANQQLLDDIALARQRAINSRSPVYLLFMPPGDPTIYQSFLNQTQQNQMLAWQYTSYAMFADRSVGDQPGRPFKRYLTTWKTLPDGVYIAPNKFSGPSYSNLFNGVIKQVLPFEFGAFPFPSGDSQNFITNAYIKFDEQGRLVLSPPPADNTCIIPLARGSILLYTDPNTGVTQATPPQESAANSSTDTNTYNHIEIDALTGRARLDRRTL